MSLTRRTLVASALSVVLLGTAATVAGCGSSGGERYTRKQAQKQLGKLEKPGVSVGEFRLTKVVDGDTIYVEGLDKSLRLLGVDTEETFKHEEEKREYEAGWEAYLKKKRGTSARPVKMATPMGDQAKQFAQKWFDGVDKVRIERDHPAEIRDRYERYLAYVLASKNGVWLNYNVECVRAGMGPYFTKYGYSRRYHEQFVKAEQEAKAAKRGIWSDTTEHYADYAERESWWGARGAFVEEFRKEAEGKSNYVDINQWNALSQLEENIGKEVHILGTIGNVSYGGKGPSKATLSRGQKASDEFPLVFFDRDVMGTSGVAEWRGEYVVVTGVPTLYEFKTSHKKQLQIVIDRASQIKLSPVPGLQKPAASASP